MNGQLRQGQVPVLHGVGPPCGCFQHAGIEQFKQAVFIGEPTLGFGEFAELAMHGLNGIGGINGFADVVRVLEVHRQVVPLFSTMVALSQRPAVCACASAS